MSHVTNRTHTSEAVRRDGAEEDGVVSYPLTKPTHVNPLPSVTACRILVDAFARGALDDG